MATDTVLFAVLTACTCAYDGTVYSPIQDVVEPRLRGASVALYFCKVSLRRCVRPGDRWAPAACMATKALHAAGAMVMADEFEAAGLHSPIDFIPIVLTRASRVRCSAVWTVGADKERMKTRLAASFHSFRFALHYRPRHHRNVRNHCSLLTPVRRRERHHVRGHRCAGPPWA